MVKCNTLIKGECSPILVKGKIICNIGAFECETLKLINKEK